jgi:hypothetical protein
MGIFKGGWKEGLSCPWLQSTKLRAKRKHIDLYIIFSGNLKIQNYAFICKILNRSK